jgi:hypothetical protein
MFFRCMSQVAVEQILGRLLTDAGFREKFFGEPLNSALENYPLSDTERRALAVSRASLRKDQFELQEQLIEPAICRARLTPDARVAGQPARERTQPGTGPRPFR